jgi:hypothetical protein
LLASSSAVGGGVDNGICVRWALVVVVLVVVVLVVVVVVVGVRGWG